MKINGKHWTYCTNVHPGETLEQTIHNIKNYVIPVKNHVSPAKPFGLGLRLSYQACLDLLKSGQLKKFYDLCKENDLYIFTINGFIYGHFHGKRVKEEVYYPAWDSFERFEYTNMLIKILAYLLPKKIDGSISTVPIGLKSNFEDKFQIEKAVKLLVNSLVEVFSVFESTGKHIQIALEPEPGCFLENVDQVISFFQNYIYSKKTLSLLEEQIGKSEKFCRTFLKNHLGICYDTCHMAVMFEDNDNSIKKLLNAGIPIFKIHISSALTIDSFNKEIRNYLVSFDEEIFLHQVVEKYGNTVNFFSDIPQSLQYIDNKEGIKNSQWRVHFHVPIFLNKLGKFSTTQDYIKNVLSQYNKIGCDHFEVETYTWNVLPEKYRNNNIVTSIARELNWVLDFLRWKNQYDHKDKTKNGCLYGIEQVI